MLGEKMQRRSEFGTSPSPKRLLGFPSSFGTTYTDILQLAISELAQLSS
jgi:hypothetical protein